MKINASLTIILNETLTLSLNKGLMFGRRMDMISSTVTRFAGLGLLGSIIIISGFTLMAENSTKTVIPQNIKPTSEHAISDVDESTDMPVVKLASLSVMTDYPAIEALELKPHYNMTLEERLANAQTLANVQKFDEALQMLEINPTSEDDAYKLNYLKAQILSWSGEHDKAEQAFTTLLETYPQDVDIAVSFGYLHLYQNNFDDAQRLFTQVLDRFPDYQDAQIGLKRATAIQ